MNTTGGQFNPILAMNAAGESLSRRGCRRRGRFVMVASALRAGGPGVRAGVPGQYLYDRLPESPSGAVAGTGEFVVVGAARIRTGRGAGYGVLGRLLQLPGRSAGGEYWPTATPPTINRYPDVGVDAAGNFVVVWTSRLQDGSSWASSASASPRAARRRAASFRSTASPPVCSTRRRWQSTPPAASS